MGAHDGTLNLAFDVPVETTAVPAAKQVPGGGAVPQVREAVPFTWSEEHRHACEVQYVYSLGADRAKDFCAGVEKQRGRAAAERLWREARALSQKKETDNDHA